MHRRRILLELDLTEWPVELEQDDPLSRLRHRGRRDLRSTLRALHRSADDPRVVGRSMKVESISRGGGLRGSRVLEVKFVDTEGEGDV